MGLFVKKPKLTLEQAIASDVSKKGLKETLNFWSAVNYSYRTGGAFKSSRLLGKLWGEKSGEAMKVLGSAPYAPGPSLETHTLEEARQAEMKRAARRSGRRRTRITGELEPQTTKKALLG